MEDLYERLEFKRPDFLENPYGIKIYLGTKGKDDWAVEIPKKLSKKLLEENSHYNYYYEQDLIFYMVSEKEALEIAAKFTYHAKII